MPRIFIVMLLFCQQSFSQQKCENNRLPIVFVHGFMGSGDNWATQAERFSSRGFCEDRLFVFDWNTIGGKQNTDSLLNSFIDTVLKKTRSAQINLVAHSAGGGLCYRYLRDPQHAAKVAHYIHIGSIKMKTPAGKNGEVPTMNIYSTDDNVMRGGADIPGAINIRESGNDHMQVATCAETFSNMYSFFTGNKKVNSDITEAKGLYRSIGGRAVILAENTPMSLDSFRVFLINPKTGQRDFNKKHLPDGEYVGWTAFDKDGNFGFELNKDSYTEFQVHPKGGRNLFYFFEPLKRNNKNVYLRGLPASGMAANMLGGIPNDSLQTALVIFTSNSAVIAGRDTLAIDSIPLSLPALMPAAKTSIATFLFDDGDKLSSGKALRSFSMAPFMTGADVFIKADDKKTMRIFYNGRSIILPKRKSDEGITILVLN